MSDLGRFNGRSVAVIVQMGLKQVLLKGIATYEPLNDLGPSLRIEVGGESEIEFVIQEAEFAGEIYAVDELKAEFLLVISSQPQVGSA